MIIRREDESPPLSVVQSIELIRTFRRKMFEIQEDGWKMNWKMKNVWCLIHHHFSFNIIFRSCSSWYVLSHVYNFSSFQSNLQVINNIRMLLPPVTREKKEKNEMKKTEIYRVIWIRKGWNHRTERKSIEGEKYKQTSSSLSLSLSILFHDQIYGWRERILIQIYIFLPFPKFDFRSPIF